MTCTAIVQARMGSTRLPGKVLMDLCGKTVVEHVIERVGRAATIDRIVLATSDNDIDTPLAETAGRAGVRVYRGSESDVLDRYYQAAVANEADPIVRITADCPVIDPGVIDAVVELFRSERPDYCSNVMPRTFADGLDVEVVSHAALSAAWREAREPRDREHVTLWIRNRPDRFRFANYAQTVDEGQLRWTLDRDDDLVFIRRVFDGLYHTKPDFRMEDIHGFLSAHPELHHVNP